VPQLALAALIALAVVAPLLASVWRVVRSGDYVAPAAALKSSAKGVDVATLLLGPPFSGAIGDPVRQIYERLAIDPMESSAWLGVIVFVSVLLSLRRSWADAELRRWIVIGVVFAVWALGPYLGVSGVNTGLILPQALAHLVPVINNARIPSRAMVMVDLCAVVLTAVALTRVAAARGRAVAALLVCLAIAERLAFPLPVSAVGDSGVNRLIAADRAGGAVLTVPFGVRDGFAERGRLEADALYGQTAHRHPLVGGFVARLPPRVGDWYASTEPFATLLRLSERGGSSDFPDCPTVAAGLARAAVSFLVLYRADASADLIRFVEAGMPVSMVEADGTRTLFRVSERGCAAR
jgi:hypothetical protein